jgi:hypothetical protein
MKKKLFFIGMVVVALVLTSGSFAYTFNNSSATLQATLADTPWATYRVADIQPEWVSVLPEGATGSDVLVPDGEGAVNDGLTQFPDSGEPWDKVDDQPSDENLTYLSTEGDSTWMGDIFQISNPNSGMDAITSISIYVRYASAGDWTVKAMTEIITNDQQFSGVTESTSSTDWVTVSTQYDVNPANGEAWTADEVNALQAGVTLKGAGKTKPVYCTQVYVQVNYTTSGASQGEIPHGDLYNITPDTNYMGDLTVKIYITNTADLAKAYDYLNMKIYVAHSTEAGNTPDFKVLSLENGVVEFSIIGGSAAQYTVSVTGGSYGLVSDNPAEWLAGYTLTPEFYCEITQR